MNWKLRYKNDRKLNIGIEKNIFFLQNEKKVVSLQSICSDKCQRYYCTTYGRSAFGRVFHNQQLMGSLLRLCP